MKIGIGLPNTIPGAKGATIVEWARRAEERGFSSLGTLDRIVFPSYESLLALAAAASVTSRARLITNVLLGPTRNPILLAKDAASLDQLSGGRFVLGVGVGGREDDFPATGQEFKNRGKRWDADLELMSKAWAGEHVAGSPQAVTPTPMNGKNVPILIGGSSDAALARTIKWGIGWTAGGGGADRAAPFVERVRQGWKEAGREGSPELVALLYFALGDKAEEGTLAYLSNYYGDWGQGIAQNSPKTPEALKAAVQRFEEAGFTELILDPTLAEIDQVDRLADAVL